MSASKLISADRYLIKIIDRTISLQDIGYQYRNLSSLHCLYSDAFLIEYFRPQFLKEMDEFLKKFPVEDAQVSAYLHAHEELLLHLRQFFKMIRYSEDQKNKVTPELERLIRLGTKESHCETAVLYKDTLKTNFISLLQTEIYLRTRYGAQVKAGSRNFDSIRPSVDLFVDSLDKQFNHEYYW